VVPSSPVLLNFEDETKVNNMLIIDTPKNVTQAAKEAKKASVTATKEDDGSKDKKETKSESKSSNTTIAQADKPTEETQVATKEPEPVQAEIVTKLDIEKIDPSVNSSIMDSMSKQPNAANTNLSNIPTISVPSSTVNNGFTTNGTHAILYITNNNNLIWYTMKFDANATFNITTRDGSKEYPLNFGSKLKVNITQK
jgi:hypothetical protein